MRIDQLVPAFHRGDAIGDEAFELRGFFARPGIRVRNLLPDAATGGSKSQARLFGEFPPPRPRISPSSISPCRRPSPRR